jgi:hypothetical protein
MFLAKQLSELSQSVILNNKQEWKAVHMHPKHILCNLASFTGPDVHLLQTELINSIISILYTIINTIGRKAN